MGQIFKVVFLNDGGELGPRPLSQERETIRCVDLNNNPGNFFQHPGGSMGPTSSEEGHSITRVTCVGCGRWSVCGAGVSCTLREREEGKLRGKKGGRILEK